LVALIHKIYVHSEDGASKYFDNSKRSSSQVARRSDGLRKEQNKTKNKKKAASITMSLQRKEKY
jgi:hypothetical protein